MDARQTNKAPARRTIKVDLPSAGGFAGGPSGDNDYDDACRAAINRAIVASGGQYVSHQFKRERIAREWAEVVIEPSPGEALATTLAAGLAATRADDLLSWAAAPCWEDAGKVHDWRNHVPGEVQDAWPGLPPEARLVAAAMARARAEAEEWD